MSEKQQSERLRMGGAKGGWRRRDGGRCRGDVDVRASIEIVLNSDVAVRSLAARAIEYLLYIALSPFSSQRYEPAQHVVFAAVDTLLVARSPVPYPGTSFFFDLM
jgi:hypothetical protein